MSSRALSRLNSQTILVPQALDPTRQITIDEVPGVMMPN